MAKTTAYNNLVKHVNDLLDQNTEWEGRFGKYIDEIGIPDTTNPLKEQIEDALKCIFNALIFQNLYASF